MSFENFLRLIKDQDPVQSGTVNRPLRDIDQNVRYLWEVIQAAGIGSTVYAHRQTVEPTLHQGMAVWLNPQTQRFEGGLAVTAVDNISGAVLTAGSAQVWGIIASKLSADLADILLFGLDVVDISGATDTGTMFTGVYYLSGASPGVLTLQKPPVSVAVLRAMPNGKVFVMPQFVDFLDRHVHYKFDLTCYPAGDTEEPAPGQRHVITAGDALLPGWLPASDPSFLGKAPPGAAFGYNLEAHPALKNAWPPIPFSNAYLEWNKGLDPSIGATGVPLGPLGLVQLDRYGIWWMSDCYGDVPWPLLTDSSTNSASFSDSVDVTCPRYLDMRLTLYFTKVTFATDATAVLSLHAKDKRIKVLCYGTDLPASTGHLELDLNLDLTVTDNEPGFLALKEFDGVHSLFKRGPVVEGVYALSGNVQLVGTPTRLLNPLDLASPQVHQGLVGISVNPAAQLELPVELVWMLGAEEQFYQHTMYLGFTPAELKSYRARVFVPADVGLTDLLLKLRFQILGRAAGALPQLVFTGRRVPRPGGPLLPTALPTDSSEFAIVCDTTATLTGNNQYVEVESTPFAVAAGDTVFFTVQRLDTDAYAAEVGILRQAGILFSGD